jgi:hypothetical protein
VPLLRLLLLLILVIAIDVEIKGIVFARHGV